jgi:rhodanese-related sulfurtransferase
MQLRNAFFVAVCSLGVFSACTSKQGQSNLSVTDFEKAVTGSNFQLLDVRTPEEYASGHLKNAFLANWNSAAEFEKRVQSLDKSKPVYTYCLSGSRSNAATQWLIQNGFNAYNLSGGMIAWKGAGKPVEASVSAKQLSLAEYRTLIPIDKTVLVDFSAVWCPPCKKMAPVIDSLVITHGNLFTLVKLDGGQQIDICRQLKVAEFPTFIIYKAGKEIWRKEGLAVTKDFTVNF